MSSATVATGRSRRSPRLGLILKIAIPVVLLIAMVFGTKFVSSDSATADGPKKFSPTAYGTQQFPKVQAAIEKRAVPAAKLASALKANQSAAIKKYGVAAGTGPELSVKLTGVVGAKDSGGIYTVQVEGLPKQLIVRFQSGPAINGTDLRDATGAITFGQFTNQIDFQNAGSALNNQLKQKVLAPVDTANLKGKTVTLVGVFQLINPNGWLITPAMLKVT